MASDHLRSSSFKSSTHERPSPNSFRSSLNGSPAGATAPLHLDPMRETPEDFIGSLEVYIHQARDIHNICIYHKQDVFAKIYLTSDPEASVSTKTINGGGKNPVFNENLRLSVRTIDSSLKCEIWMLSRVRNYLEDQLLGFAVVPLSDVVIGDGKQTREFSLSSTDLFHSPAGFVELSLSYVGSLPEVVAIAQSSVIADATLPDSESGDSIPCELDKIEFPDLKIANENQRMVSEYFGIIPCDKLESECSKSLVTSEYGNCPDSEAGVHVVASFSSDGFDSVGALKSDTPPSSVSTNESPLPLPATSLSSSEPSGTTGSLEQKEKVTDGEADSSASPKTDALVPPIIKIDIEPEQTVVQQDIVDMYMKSMQQFTESLAKMKLPMDVENNSTIPESGNSGSEQKLQTPNGTGSRVFYGSRAFF